MTKDKKIMNVLDTLYKSQTDQFYTLSSSGNETDVRKSIKHAYAAQILLQAIEYIEEIISEENK